MFSKNNIKCLAVPKPRLETKGDQAFVVVPPNLWNDLPLFFKNVNKSVVSLKKLLKTQLFHKHFVLYLPSVYLFSLFVC